MGTVKINVGKSQLRHDTIHPYTSTGIRRLLRDIHRLLQMESYNGDYDAVNIRIDLESALQSDATTPRQRVAIALYYMAQLTQAECAKILGITRRPVQERVENGVANVAAYMSGNMAASTQTRLATDRISIRGHDALSAWVDAALCNRKRWWDVNDAVLADINDIVGMPNRDNMADDDNAYPYLSDRQMRTRNREHEILRPEVYANSDNVGTLRSPDDGRRMRL